MPPSSFGDYIGPMFPQEPVQSRITWEGQIGDPFDNATLRRANEALTQAENILAMAAAEKRELMELLNQALWCDIKEHAFSAKDKGKRSITLTRWDEDASKDVQDIVMACGPCASANPLIQAAQPDRPMPAADVKEQQGTRYSPEYTRALERDLGMPPS